MNTKDLREKRAAVITSAQAAYHEAIDENSTMEQIAVATAAFDSAMDEADRLKALIDNQERSDALTAETTQRREITALRAGVHAADVEGFEVKHAEAFNAWMRYGESGIPDDLRAYFDPRQQTQFSGQVFNAMGSSTDAAGGVLIPEGFESMVKEALLAYGGMRTVATVITTQSGNTIPYPTNDDTGNTGEMLANENTETTTQDLSFGSVNIGSYTFSSKLIKVSNELLQDQAINLEMFIGRKSGERIGRAENAQYTTGATAGASPIGLVNATTAGITGTTAEYDTISYETLVDVEHEVDPAYRSDAQWMMHDGFVKQIKKISDGDSRPLFVPSVNAGMPDTILGYPVIVNQQMTNVAGSTAAGGNKALLFGRLSDYLIRDVSGIAVRRLAERFAEVNQTAFVTFKRSSGAHLGIAHGSVKYFTTGASA